MLNVASLLEKLPALREDAEDAIGAAYDADIVDAVNWGDLHADVALVIAEDGSHWFRVMIEEASPSAYKFQQFIYDFLRQRGWDVEVTTEW